MHEGSSTSPIVILVIEEETSEREFVVEQINGAGFQALGASDTDEAMRLLDGRHDIRGIVTDAHVPGRVDGWQLAKQVRQNRPEISIVLMSGHSDGSNDLLVDGCEFIPKPHLTSLLIPALQRMTR